MRSRGFSGVRVRAWAARPATAAGRVWAAARPLPPMSHALPGSRGDATGEGHGGGDPDRSRLLGRWQGNGVVSERQGGAHLDRLRGHGRRWEHPEVDGLAGLDDPGLPGWAWRTASGSIRGRCPMRALASPRGP
jgi:hypothetical protein